MEICALERVGPLLPGLEEQGVPVHGTPYPTRTERSNTVTLLLTVEAIRRVVRSGRFEVVQTYLYWSDVLGVAGARLAGCRRIIVSRRSLHGAAHPPSAFLHGLEQTANRFANEVIANSKVVLKDAEAHEAQLPASRAVVYNGVDVQWYQPTLISIRGPIRLLTVGSLAPLKGQDYAVDALALLVKSGRDATLELVGAGPDESMLRTRASQAGVGDRVSFAGEQLDPRPYLARADVFVLPSRVEGFSNALLEAMASALPVVATDVGGNAEALIDGKGGRIVPPQQPGAIARAIEELAADRPKLVEMGHFNRRRVADLFSLDVSARRLAAWYLNAPIRA
jgi:glycosyltransferase involved in cell wall biosynthesis